MNPIEARIFRIETVLKNINSIVREELIKDQNFIAELNRQQLSRGENSEGDPMPNYVPDSIQPSAPGRITLFETGDFYDGIAPLFEDDHFEMIGTDDKTPFLESKYKALGLSPESIEVLRERLAVRLKKRINEQIRTK